MIHLYFKPFWVQKYSHPINSDIGNNAVRAAKTAIKEGMNSNVSWKIEQKDEVQWSIGSVQLFNNKFHVLLRPGALVFYTLLVTTLNFWEEMQKRHAISSATVCAYLPVDFRKIENSEEKLCDSIRTKKSRVCSNARQRLLQALHESIKFCLKPLTNCALQRLKFKTFDGKKILFHFLLTCYIADFCEPKICAQSNEE